MVYKKSIVRHIFLLNVAIFFFQFLLISLPVQTLWHHKSFDVAMKKICFTRSIGRTELYLGIDGISLYNFFRDLYDRYNPSVVQCGPTLKIPKIIHQIWLGSTVPDVYKAFMQTWIDIHCGQGWEYKLWTDDNVHEIVLYNKKFYDETVNYGVKSDILRWEILYQQGGLYVDVDYECLRSFDMFHYLYDFYTGIQPLDTEIVQLGAALVGSKPGHPILKQCIETIKDHWHLKSAPKKTGPLHFTQSFYAVAGQNGSLDIAFPPFYVYPLGCEEVETETRHQQWIDQGSFAIHWWSKSWMPKAYRPVKFRSFEDKRSVAHWNV
jgi:mannosyltransferase OCH1-like enzyme